MYLYSMYVSIAIRACLFVCLFVCNGRQYFTDGRFWARYCNATHDLCSGGPFSPSGVLLKAVLLHSGQQVRGSRL